MKKTMSLILFIVVIIIPCFIRLYSQIPPACGSVPPAHPCGAYTINCQVEDPGNGTNSSPPWSCCKEEWPRGELKCKQYMGWYVCINNEWKPKCVYLNTQMGLYCGNNGDCGG